MEPDTNAADGAAAPPAPKRESQLRSFLRHRAAVASGGILLLLVCAAIIVPLLWRYNYTQLTNSLNTPPSLAHPLGTDALGHDMLAQTARALGESLMIAAVVTAFAITVGSIVGLVSGYAGGRVDMVLMRFTDLIMTIPLIALAAFLANKAGSLAGPQWLHIAFVLAIAIWTWPARLVRGVALRLRSEDFVLAARASGVSRTRILATHLLPNAMSQVLVAAPIIAAVSILAESGLSFIGFGVQPPDTSLGVLVANAQGEMFTQPWLFYPPGLLIVLIALCGNFLGDGLRDTLDPRGAAMGALGLTRTARETGTPPAKPTARPLLAGPDIGGPGDALLSIRGLSVFLSDGTAILRNVSLEVGKGEVLALVGESGAGKSTVGNAIVGTLPRRSKTYGEVRYEGRQLLGLGFRAFRSIRGRAVSMILQDPMTCLNPVFTVGRQLREAYVHGRQESRGVVEARLVEILAIMGIRNPRHCYRQYPHELSGGMKQRVAIAMATCNEPGLIIADEPTTALDVTIQADVVDLLRNHCVKARAGMLFITHDMGLVAGIADRVAVMYAGSIVEYGTVEDIFERPTMPYTKALLGAVPRVGQAAGRLETIPRVITASRNLNGDSCPFADRCSVRFDRCAETPPLLPLGDGHYAACWHASSLAVEA